MVLKKLFETMSIANETAFCKAAIATLPRTSFPDNNFASCLLGVPGQIFHFYLPLRQDPLEAISVIFGRRALIFFCLKALGKNEKWRHFGAHAQWWSPWRRKNVENRAPRSVEFNFFINCDRHKRFSQNEWRRTDLQNVASHFLNFALGLSYDLSKFSDDFTPFFSTLKDHN